MKIAIPILLIPMLGLVIAGCVTPATPSEKTMTVVFDVKGVDKKELFVRANTWFVANFKDAKSVIQFNDKESGKIAGKYYAEVTSGVSIFGTRQMIEVDVKDEKARIVFQDPMMIFLGSAFGTKGEQAGFDWQDVNQKGVMDAIRVKWQNLASSLEEKLKKADSF